jgi:L-fuconolactonase
MVAAPLILRSELSMPQTRPVDAHHHLWRYTPDEYAWITDEMELLRRDWLPRDLRPLLDDAGIAGAIAVQARQTIAETEWLLEETRNHPWIEGAVGWLPLASADFPGSYEATLSRDRLKGLRHIVQDEPDDDFILSAAFNRGVRALRGTGLVYDILIHTRHLPQAIQFVDAHPDQPFVLDHCAKPPLRSDELDFWSAHIREFARRPNVACKLSGLVTEADWQHWSAAELEPCWQVVLEAFGPARLMFGSDWPVALLASSYQRWVETIRSWTGSLSSDEQASIWGGTARRVYRLEPD